MAALADEQTTDWWTARKRAAARTTPSLTGPATGAWRRAWALDARSSRSSRSSGRAGVVGGQPGGLAPCLIGMDARPGAGSPVTEASWPRVGRWLDLAWPGAPKIQMSC